MHRHAPLPVLALVAALVVVAACGGGGADASPDAAKPTPGPGRGVRLVTVGRFDEPVFVTAPRRDRRRLFVVEQGGRIRVVRDGRKLARPFLDLRSRVLAGGERGLLSLAFAPDYAGSRRFYVYFTGRDTRQHVVEYRAASPDRADPASARPVLVMDDPEDNHNGGLLLFGGDRHLYVGTGDGGGGNDQHGSRGNAQDLGSLLGKILRIDPAAAGGRPYTVPASNPFTGRRGARPEVYSFGLRNPWRFSFDRRTDALLIGDVGQDAIEEIDAVRAGGGRGANFGWRPFEGRRRNFDEPAPQAVPPVITHAHRDGFCSITGGVVVRDPRVPGLAGRYVYGDLCEGALLSARITPGRRATPRRVGRLRVESLTSFGEDALGRVYATSLAGPVYRLAAAR
jgi:glucose/arabinose dehydrogenase